MNKNLLSESDNPDRQVRILTRSPNQHPDYETPDEFLSVDEYKDCVPVFADKLENKQKDVSPFCTRGRHEGYDVFCLSLRYFKLLLLIRDNSNIIILLKQTARTVQTLIIVIAGFDMSYDDLEDICREAGKEKHGYLQKNRIDD